MTYEGWEITRSDREGKKYKATSPDGRVEHFGASGYRINPERIRAIATALVRLESNQRSSALIGGPGSYGRVKVKGRLMTGRSSD